MLVTFKHKLTGLKVLANTEAHTLVYVGRHVAISGVNNAVNLIVDKPCVILGYMDLADGGMYCKYDKPRMDGWYAYRGMLDPVEAGAWNASHV